MDQKIAADIVSLLASARGEKSKYALVEHIESSQLSGFHQWADSRKCEGAFLFKDQQGKTFWFVFVDWQRKGNFYLVVFPESKLGPIAEIHSLTGNQGEYTLSWKYSPVKRDGRNLERKAYFTDAFLSTNVHISVPSDSFEIEDFIDEIFSLAISRLKADILDPERPLTRTGFPEGKRKERIHLSRERNQDLVRQAKHASYKQDGRLFCACCGFDFHAVYGEVGMGFIEAHHTKPVSELHEDGEETKIEDLALVCSNCHRMLHRKRPWLGINELKKLLLDENQ